MVPRLIHPIAVRLVQVDGARTAVDPTWGEPVGAVATRAVDLVGQLRELRGRQLQMTGGGASGLANSTGHVVFEIDALDAAGVTLHLGDRITALAGRPVDPPHRILVLEDKAHYAGRAWHRYAYFGPEGA